MNVTRWLKRKQDEQYIASLESWTDKTEDKEQP